MIRRIFALGIAVASTQSACADHHEPVAADKAAEEAMATATKKFMPSSKVETDLYFVTLNDGDVVSSPFRVVFGLRGMGVAPAGVDVKNTGHHHLLIDVDELPDMSAPLPATDNIRHFGGGQTQTTVTLPPGEHTLQLLLGNYLHVPFAPPIMSQKITLTVK